MNQQRQQALDDQRNRIMARADKKIWVTFQKEGIHKYPAAATDPELATGDEYDVSFLGYPHRHIFHFRVWIDVLHSDRDIEFIQFKRWLENLYKEGTLQLDFKSSEMMSDDLYIHIANRYPDRSIWIEVSEDGENGALIKYETHQPLQTIKI
jgi:hypothetical protein